MLPVTNGFNSFYDEGYGKALLVEVPKVGIILRSMATIHWLAGGLLILLEMVACELSVLK